MEEHVIHYVTSHTFLPTKKVAEMYGFSVSSVCRILKEIESCDRYRGAWITSNGSGTREINTLVFEDFLHYRDQLKNRNMARKLPPYDPAEVRKQRGEYKVPVLVDDDDLVEKEASKTMKAMKNLYKAMKEVFEEGA